MKAPIGDRDTRSVKNFPAAASSPSCASLGPDCGSSRRRNPPASCSRGGGKGACLSRWSGAPPAPASAPHREVPCGGSSVSSPRSRHPRSLVSGAASSSIRCQSPERRSGSSCHGRSPPGHAPPPTTSNGKGLPMLSLDSLSRPQMISPGPLRNQKRHTMGAAETSRSAFPARKPRTIQSASEPESGVSMPRWMKSLAQGCLPAAKKRQPGARFSPSTG